MDYHAGDYGLTRSALSVFMTSPEDYYLQYIMRAMPRKQPTTAMDIGTVVHRILLDRVDFDDAVAVYPSSCLKSDGSLNPKPAAQFRQDNAGLICLKEDKAECIRRAVHAARLSELGPLLGGNYHFEMPVQAEVFGVQCACRPDIWGVTENKAVIFDLKVMEDDHAGLFHRNAKRLRYWLQVAHYSRIINAKTGLNVEFKFFSLRTSPPYRVQSFWYGDSLENGLRQHAATLDEYRRCYDSGNWPHKYNQVLQVEPWDVDCEIEIDGAEEIVL